MSYERKSLAKRCGAIGAWIVAAAGTFAVIPLGITATAPAETRCVRYWGEARYVVGFDHLVHLTSSCDQSATCAVSSDLNRAAQTVRVGPGEHRVVTTYLGAATSSFTPIVACTLDEKS